MQWIQESSGSGDGFSSVVVNRIVCEVSVAGGYLFENKEENKERKKGRDIKKNKRREHKLANKKQKEEKGGENNLNIERASCSPSNQDN